MFRCISSSRRPARLGGRCIGAVAVACVSLAGCSTLNCSDLDFSRAEGLSPAPPPHWSQDFRPPDNQMLPHAVTNKGMQIERSLGVR